VPEHDGDRADHVELAGALGQLGVEPLRQAIPRGLLLAAPATGCHEGRDQSAEQAAEPHGPR
jgi:hypothetical protein